MIGDQNSSLVLLTETLEERETVCQQRLNESNSDRLSD